MTWQNVPLGTHGASAPGYTVNMIHKTPGDLVNEFAVHDDEWNHDDGMLIFTYDPTIDGHFYCEMETGGVALARALVSNSPGNFRTIAVGDGRDPSLAELADDVVDTVVDSEKLLRGLFTQKPEQHTVVYIEEPERVVLHRTGRKTSTETVVASEVNRGLLAALLAQDPKTTGVSVVMRSSQWLHPSAHRIAKRHLISSRERYGYAYEHHITRGWVKVPGEKETYSVRLVGTYEGMDEQELPRSMAQRRR